MKGSQILIRAALLGGIVATSAGWAKAQEVTIQDLDQKIRVLERKLEIADENAANKAKEATVVKADKSGFVLSAPDKSFQLKLSGYAQGDARFFVDDPDEKSTDTFVLRRVRPVLDVTVYKDYAFRLQPDFGGSSPTTQDAYGEYVGVPAFNVRVGKFKTPLGLEFLQSDSQMLFAERALPTQLVPNRDVGLQFSGDLVGTTGAVTYALGVFNGAIDGGNSDGDNNDPKDLVARLFLHPFRPAGIESLKNFGVGIGASVGDQAGTALAPNLPSFKTSGQQTFFAYKASTNANGTVYADGQRVRVSPQAYYYLGPFGLLTEYVQSAQDVSTGQAQDTLDNEAWQVSFAYVLTGEDASFKDVNPLFNFDPSKGHWGAFEVVARYGELKVDHDAFNTFADPTKSARRATSVAGGLNWYLNRNMKLLFDYEQTAFDGGAAKGADRPEEKLLLARAQFSF